VTFSLYRRRAHCPKLFLSLSKAAGYKRILRNLQFESHAIRHRGFHAIKEKQTAENYERDGGAGN